MAVSINACIKLLSPPPNPSSPLAKPAISPWSSSSTSSCREAWWRSRCVSTAAILIIGTTTGFAVGDAQAEAGLAVAGGVPSYVERMEGKVAMRWSDKRKCPPWHVNSLENVVPENLPRPSDRRRSGGFVAYDQTAPSPWIGGSCFSM